MDKLNKLFKYFSIIALIFYSQPLSQDFVELETFGNFESALTFTNSPENNFFIIDSEQQSILKIDMKGNLLNEIGGYGWEKSSFDGASDIDFNSLKIFIADKNNNRIQVFDRYLNFLFQIKSESDLIYPISCAVSDQGDLFVLDSDNSRILKYDMFGNFISEIGYFNNGDFSLVNPKKLVVSQNSEIFVLDENQIVIFDLFGTGKSKINLKKTYSNIHISQNKLLLICSDEILTLNLKEKEFKKVNLLKNPESEIKDALFLGEFLWVLSEKSFHKYELILDAKN